VTGDSESMLAVRLPAWGSEPFLVSVPKPVPVGREVLLAVEGAGVCQSDLHIIDAGEGMPGIRPDFTLGHEVAGRVVGGGPQSGVPLGTRAVVYGPWGCGSCTRCTADQDNYCDRRRTLNFVGAGIGRDGGMAEFMIVPSDRYLVPIGALPAAAAAPLADAALTSWHALRTAARAGSEVESVLVLGVGGLGHLAIQLARATTEAVIIATDRREMARRAAGQLGADLVLDPDDDLVHHVRQATGGSGVDLVLDLVGSDSTLATAVSTVRPGGDIVVVGSAGGELRARKGGQLPPGVRVSFPGWGTRAELVDVVEMARAGALTAEVREYDLADAPRVLQLLREGKVTGRAVLVPKPAESR
jgi:propanol-preferring alcohol dehydrogenase